MRCIGYRKGNELEVTNRGMRKPGPRPVCKKCTFQHGMLRTISIWPLTKWHSTHGGRGQLKTANTALPLQTKNPRVQAYSYIQILREEKIASRVEYETMPLSKFFFFFFQGNTATSRELNPQSPLFGVPTTRPKTRQSRLCPLSLLVLSILCQLAMISSSQNEGVFSGHR